MQRSNCFSMKTILSLDLGPQDLETGRWLDPKDFPGFLIRKRQKKVPCRGNFLTHGRSMKEVKSLFCKNGETAKLKA